MRLERHRQYELERQRKWRNAIITVLLLCVLTIAAGIAGSMDYEDEMRQTEFWAAQGVTIQRW